MTVPRNLCAWIQTILTTSVVLSSFCFGVFMMAVLMALYYSLFFPTAPSASLEHTGMYDYISDYASMSGDVSHVVEDVGGDKVPEFEDYGLYRPKRNPEAAVPVDAGPRSANPAMAVTAAKFKNGTQNAVENTTQRTAVDEKVDQQLANKFVDSVFSHADKENWSQLLGLCRKTTDVKVADFPSTVFPLESGCDVVGCINDVLRDETRDHKLCTQLDPEMNAYLKWLVLTGEPKEKHKAMRLSLNEEFLFSSENCDPPRTFLHESHVEKSRELVKEQYATTAQQETQQPQQQTVQNTKTCGYTCSDKKND